MEMNYPVRRNDLCCCGFSIANSGLFHQVLTSPGCILIDGRACSLLSWSRNMLRCLEFGPNQALSHTEWHKYLKQLTGRNRGAKAVIEEIWAQSSTLPYRMAQVPGSS